jgi:hypothetical protein
MLGNCDECGAPATRAARDLEDATEPGDVWRNLKPARSGWRRGCDVHPPAPSCLVGAYGRIVGRLVDDVWRPIPEV